MIHHLATLVLGPILLLQGRHVRRNIPRLPEAPGPRRGTVGKGPTIRLLITGDSAAAGVGARSQEEALAGQIVADLRADHRVTWQLEASTGATTADTLDRLDALGSRRFDVLVTSLGVNDVTRGVDLGRWMRQQRALVDVARGRFGVELFVIAGLPPVDGFPALPQPLRWYLGRRAREFTAHLRRWVDGEPGAHFVDLRFSLDASLMASDGFHPGPEIYAGWGERAARLVRAHSRRGPDRAD
jgi:lysophospholipase L1-like esterase